jgi:hypothetical protein
VFYRGVRFIQGPLQELPGPIQLFMRRNAAGLMVVAGGLRASDEERHAVSGCVVRACRAVIAKEREFAINFSFECVCIGVA